MAYLHCHTCNWSQDDFWDFKINLKSSRPFGYNPFSCVIEDIIEYIFKPRIIEFDYMWAKVNGFKSNKIHSWVIFFHEFQKNVKRFFHMRWWTYEAWKRARNTAKCPSCGDRNFDID